MAERKVVGRKIAIMLSVVCIVLAVSLVFALVVYLPTAGKVDSLNAEITAKNNSIAALNAQIQSLQYSANTNNQDTSSKDAEIAQLEAQVQSLYNVLYLNATGVLVNNQGFSEGANTSTTVWDESQPLQFAGYVTVQVQSSSNLTYVQMLYNSHGVIYNNVVTVGASGTAAFPVLPGAVAILIGNTEPTDSVTGTTTILYYY